MKKNALIILGILILIGLVVVYTQDTKVLPTQKFAVPVSESESSVVTNVKNKAVMEDTTHNPALPILGEAPELTGLTNWINSEPITSMEELRGKVVLIDFWTLGCINCIRTLPHVTSLYEKYEEQGFVILGLHAPEFAYERKIENVKASVAKHGITYPVAQDNDFGTWKNYNNRYWPAHYLIDKEGNVRYTHFGEGKYQEMDDNVALLLAE